MEFYDVLQKRKSVRSFTPDPVEPEKLQRILEAARIAPSWCNRQCWRFVVVDDPNIKQLLSQELDNPSPECYREAPVVIAACADPSDSGHFGGKEYYMADCAIATQQLILAATAEGIASCWIGGFAEIPVRNLLGIPKDVKIVGLIPMGYANEVPEETPRKPYEEIVYRNGWLKS